MFVVLSHFFVQVLLELGLAKEVDLLKCVLFKSSQKLIKDI